MYTIEEERVTADYPETSSFEDFLNRMELRVISRTQNELQFDLKNTHASIANALRRILISEVPTMAIHDVSVRENNTIFPDEYLAHRLGLVPVIFDVDCLTNDEESNTLQFKLAVVNNTQNIQLLYSDSLEWIPLPGQENLTVKVQPDVLICKLAPGNEIDMELVAKKGTGAKHAKWSPVSLCSYRLMPRIELLREFRGEDARLLQKCFSPGVIDIQDDKAVVTNPRLDSMSREVFRHPTLKKDVVIQREHDWFCFTVETIWEDPVVVLRKALRVLKENCSNIHKAVIKELNPNYGN